MNLLRRHPLASMLFACTLYGLALITPTMRWGTSEKHPVAGSARLLGDGTTLVELGFHGAELVPISVVGVPLLAVAALTLRGTALAWMVLAILVLAALYAPLWVAHVFVRKLEDGVWPAEGAVLLFAAASLMLLALWAWRPARSREGVPPLNSTPTAND